MTSNTQSNQNRIKQTDYESGSRKKEGQNYTLFDPKVSIFAWLFKTSTQVFHTIVLKFHSAKHAP